MTPGFRCGSSGCQYLAKRYKAIELRALELLTINTAARHQDKVIYLSRFGVSQAQRKEIILNERIIDECCNVVILPAVPPQGPTLTGRRWRHYSSLLLPAPPRRTPTGASGTPPVGTTPRLNNLYTLRTCPRPNVWTWRSGPASRARFPARRSRRPRR